MGTDAGYGSRRTQQGEMTTGFRRADLQAAFLVPGDRAFRVSCFRSGPVRFSATSPSAADMPQGPGRRCLTLSRPSCLRELAVRVGLSPFRARLRRSTHPAQLEHGIDRLIRPCWHADSAAELDYLAGEPVEFEPVASFEVMQHRGLEGSR